PGYERLCCLRLHSAAGSQLPNNLRLLGSKAPERGEAGIPVVESQFQPKPTSIRRRNGHLPRRSLRQRPRHKKVLDCLISLPSKYPNQSHVFLCGNHDLAFAAFLGVLPAPKGDDSWRFRETWREYEESEDREGWYLGDGFEDMHLQGRRWGGKIKVRFNTAKGTEYKGSMYDAAPTFESYGVFLMGLLIDRSACGPGKREKCCRTTEVTQGWRRESSRGGRSVWDIPEELTSAPTVVASGHHGKLAIEGLRLVIDEGGGYEHKPIAAIVLSSMKIVRDADFVK
ncbi:Tyrosine-protein phosphatase RLPH2-like protein, partial [Drosera capensis]